MFIPEKLDEGRITLIDASISFCRAEPYPLGCQMPCLNSYALAVVPAKALDSQSVLPSLSPKPAATAHGHSAHHGNSECGRDHYP